jgi:hypothetical protein
MEILLVAAVFVLFAMFAGGQQPAPPHAPKVVYVVAEPHKAAESGGCLLLFVLAAIILVALSLPA